MKRITTFLTLLLLSVVTVTAQTVVSIGASTGKFYQGGTEKSVTSSNQYLNKWVSTRTPALTFSCSANNMIINSNYPTDTKMNLHTDPQNYTLSFPYGKILSYSIKAYATNTSSTINGTVVSNDAENPTTVEVTDINSSTATIVIAGTANPWMYITEFNVTVEDPTEEQAAAYEKIQAWLPLMQESMALVTDASNYLSAHKQADEGTYAALLDKDNSTYFHSAWGGSSSGKASDSGHDLQAKLPEATTSLYIYFVSRANGTGIPSAFRIDGSNNASDFTEDHTASTTWTQSVGQDNGSMPTGASQSYLSSKITLSDAYQYLRFVPTIYNNQGKNWFCLAEFWLFPSNEAVDAAISMMKNVVSPLDITGEMIPQIDQIDTDLRSTSVEVTYELYKSDGTTLISSETVTQLKNSVVSIPSNMKSNEYYYNYTTEGTIGNSNCTIKVTRTLKDPTIVEDLANLSNSKAYYITTFENKRKSLSTYTSGDNTYLASDLKESLNISPKKFAIINYEDNLYLYSVEDEKFVLSGGGESISLADMVTGTTDRVTLTTTSDPLWLPKFNDENGKVINTSGSYAYAIVVNSWGSSASQWDDGCQYTIHDAGEFDPQYVLAALEEFFHPTNYYSFVESEVLPYLFATASDPNSGAAASVGKYFGISADVAAQVASTYATQIANKNFTEDEYNAIKAAVLGAVVYPETGYYRIKNTNRGRNSYLTYGIPSNYSGRGDGLVAVDESTAISDAGSIIKLTKTGDNNYTFGTEGMVVYAPTQNNYPFRTSGSEGDAVTYKFTVTSPGVVAIGPADVTDPNAQRYFHEGDGATWGEVHAVVQWTATAGASQWTVEEANELGQGTYALEIALTTIDSKSYATTYLPFPVTLSDDAEAYTVKIDGKKAVETLLGNEIPAEAPVLLISETAAEKVYATVAEVNATVSDNDLKGVYKKTNQADLEGELPVVLNVVNEKVGFYKLAETGSLPANKAFMSYTEGSSTSKEFFEEGFELGSNEATGINTIENGADNGAIYNLQGQRVNKAQKGVFIQNGKKVVLK